VLFKLFGLVPGVGGTVLLGYSLLQLGRAYRSLRWPVRPGEVLSASVATHRGRRVSYEPVVKYRYEWDHIAYEGSRIVFSAMSVTGSLDGAEQVLKHLPIGSRIPVHVCPAKRQLCVIKPGFEPGWWIPLALSVVAILFGFSFWNTH
jgi:hypothetical protein